MLHYHGFATRSDVTSQFVGWDKADDIGRADIFAARLGKAVHIEVKRGVEGFNLDDWRENQRAWGLRMEQFPFSVPYYLFLTIGKHPPHYNPATYMPRRSWLVPIQQMLDVDALVRPHQKTLVWQAKPRMKRLIQQFKLDAVTLLKEYELVWQAQNTLKKPEWFEDKAGDSYGGFWVVPATHEFYGRFELGLLAEEQVPKRGMIITSTNVPNADIDVGVKETTPA